MSPVFITAIEFSKQIETLQSGDDVWAAFLSLANGYGFKYAGYLSLPAPGENLPGNVVYHASPPGWFMHYVQHKYIERDPLLLHLSRTLSPYTLDDVLTCTAYTADQRLIRKEAAEFGLTSNFNVPVRSPSNGRAAVCYAGDRSPLAPHERAELHLAACIVDLSLRPPHVQNPHLPALTDREHECLKWTAAGKSDYEIGEILGISEKTVNFHIESVKRKYGVNSRTLAATMAVQAGVVQV